MKKYPEEGIYILDQLEVQLDDDELLVKPFTAGKDFKGWRTIFKIADVYDLAAILTGQLSLSEIKDEDFHKKFSIYNKWRQRRQQFMIHGIGD